MISKKTRLSAIIGALLAAVLLFGSPALAETDAASADEGTMSMKTPLYWWVLGIVGTVITVVAMGAYVWYDVRNPGKI
ncbi:hypothetical protein MsAg5_16080 [Methanosarcinaceae archaeon Ag5]|uniref:Uncharacterized protein n=1 Tax=Methanolapillus africanus TaxID=3028297 RepID=A0AAE4SDS4_9EURY|nr:hypothetical protein [Methanosarcinaceae archaeon Ag5]